MSKKVYRLPGQYKNERAWRRYGLITLVLAGLLAGGVYLQKYLSNQSTPNPAKAAVETKPVAPKVSAVEGRYMFSGTVVLGRGVEQQAQVAGGYNYAQPFSEFASFKPEQYDGWLIDLECPVTTNSISFRRQVDELRFNCRPEWLPELTKYIKYINLANNHTFDMGADGFLETQRTLDAAGVQTVGNFQPSVTKDTCEVMSLPVRLQTESAETSMANLPIAFCAWHYFFGQPKPGELEVMERYAKIMPVFSLMHVGAEYYPTASPNQTDLARKLIDLGAEFVIGNSPHWVQNSEVYKGKLIAYSTGNFIFDQLDAETNRGLNLDVTVKTKYDKNLAAWLQLGESCKTRGDDCLAKAEQQGLKKISLNYNFEPVASAGGYKQLTRKGDDALQQAVRERLNWTDTLQKLNAN